ncbi:GAF domain-containing protein [Mycolicibacterium madagascariense]|uniref:GAF domain-containing protein n=1 Tax=Mycolicibacterium madagascariense TaxID=212765 RepID=A0A7I7XH88_9MYCO|nr:GAF and ANTAR domain-containing protein [Mycolicibacterium madagascariense]MCV7014343.1 GAF and ANTAR domain-containing protein [Mycolicibacterium madagascariense]BBZ28566.1 GAF domain-containing protein [Mycolicibacterium madagascariense]
MTQGEQLLASVGALQGVAAADKICSTCVTLLDVHATAISLVSNGANLATLGASSPAARLYDEVQFTVGEGPCLSAVADRAPIVIPDLDDPADTRWALYRPVMLAHDIRAVTAIPVMVAGEGVGAFNVFLDTPGTLTEEALALSRLAADLARLPLLSLLDEHLRAAAADPDTEAWTELHLLARTDIAQATGMVMAQLDVDAEEALVRLRAHAYATSSSPTDIARAIIDRRVRLTPP